VANVSHPCASLCIHWSSFFALLHVDGQEVPSGLPLENPFVHLFSWPSASSDVRIRSSAGY